MTVKECRDRVAQEDYQTVLEVLWEIAAQLAEIKEQLEKNAPAKWVGGPK